MFQSGRNYQSNNKAAAELQRNTCVSASLPALPAYIAAAGTD